VTDSNGVPLAAVLSAGQRHEVPVFPALMDQVRLPTARGRPRCRPRCLTGDKAYGYEPVFAYLRRRGIRAAIPQRSGPNAGRPHLPVDPDTYRRRNAVERAVGWLKGCRSIATRHDKLATSFLAMLKLAFLRQYMHVLRPSDTT
jgi:transposase